MPWNRDKKQHVSKGRKKKNIPKSDKDYRPDLKRARQNQERASAARTFHSVLKSIGANQRGNADILVTKLADAFKSSPELLGHCFDSSAKSNICDIHRFLAEYGFDNDIYQRVQCLISQRGKPEDTEFTASYKDQLAHVRDTGLGPTPKSSRTNKMKRLSTKQELQRQLELTQAEIWARGTKFVQTGVTKDVNAALTRFNEFLPVDDQIDPLPRHREERIPFREAPSEVRDLLVKEKSLKNRLQRSEAEIQARKEKERRNLIERLGLARNDKRSLKELRGHGLCRIIV